MLPVPLALSAYFCLTLVPDASCSPLSDIQNICYKESPKLGKKKKWCKCQVPIFHLCVLRLPVGVKNGVIQTLFFPSVIYSAYYTF